MRWPAGGGVQRGGISVKRPELDVHIYCAPMFFRVPKYALVPELERGQLVVTLFDFRVATGRLLFELDEAHAEIKRLKQRTRRS